MRIGPSARFMTDRRQRSDKQRDRLILQINLYIMIKPAILNPPVKSPSFITPRGQHTWLYITQSTNIQCH